MASKKNYFVDILKAVSKSRRELGDRKKRTFEWFRQNAAEIRKLARQVKSGDIEPKDVMTQRPELLSKKKRVSKNLIGKMFFFYYDPKLKNELPYYDIFPLVMPISVEKDRMTCLNFHYIPPNARAVLMGHLYSLLEDEPDDEKRIDLSYAILKSASQYALFRPCIKTYLFSHVRSRYRFVPPEEWDLSLMLPVAQFQKASETRVWADSIKMVNDATKKKSKGTP